MEFVFHECWKDEVIADLEDTKKELKIQLDEAKQQNYRLQVQLIEKLSGTELKINLFEQTNPVSIEIDSKEEGVSIEVCFNNCMGCKTILNIFQ